MTCPWTGPGKTPNGVFAVSPARRFSRSPFLSGAERQAPQIIPRHHRRPHRQSPADQRQNLGAGAVALPAKGGLEQCLGKTQGQEGGYPWKAVRLPAGGRLSPGGRGEGENDSYQGAIKKIFPPLTLPLSPRKRWEREIRNKQPIERNLQPIEHNLVSSLLFVARGSRQPGGNSSCSDS